MKEIKHVGFGVNGFQLRDPFEGRSERPVATNAIEYLAAHHGALMVALEYIRDRKEEALAAYLTDDAGNWQAEIEALASIREAISSIDPLYADDMARADAYREYLHLRACNAEEEVERLRATTCPCKGTDDLCRCQNVRPSTSRPTQAPHLENDDNG